MKLGHDPGLALKKIQKLGPAIPATWKGKAGRLKIQGPPGLQSGFKASWRFSEGVV